jgi:uncharacterized protein (DUF3820 family)
MAVMPFGKHRGEDIEDVPSDYLQWFLTKVDAPPKGDPNRDAHLNLVSEIESELASRKKYGPQR